jgi:hypothetical protein
VLLHVFIFTMVRIAQGGAELILPQVDRGWIGVVEPLRRAILPAEGGIMRLRIALSVGERL